MIVVGLIRNLFRTLVDTSRRLESRYTTPELEEFENRTLFLWLGLPSILIRHKNVGFQAWTGLPYSSRKLMYFITSLIYCFGKICYGVKPVNAVHNRPSTLLHRLTCFFFFWKIGNLLNEKISSQCSLNEIQQEAEDAMADGESRKSWNCAFLATLTISIISILIYAFMWKPSLSD